MYGVDKDYLLSDDYVKEMLYYHNGEHNDFINLKH